MDTPTPVEGFVVGSWPRTMLVIPGPDRYHFESAIQARCRMYPVTIVGPHAVPIISYNDRPRNRGLSVEFVPGGAFRLFGLPEDAFANRMVDAREVLPATVADTLVAAVWHQTDPAAIIRDVFRAILAYYRTRSLPDLPVDLNAALRMISDGSVRTVAGLAAAVDRSPRHIRRVFCHYLGISPKKHMAIARVLVAAVIE